MRRLAALCAATVLVGIFVAPTAHAVPGIPNCPGNGNDSVGLGMDGGWCNYLYLPDGTHVSCRWADWSFLIGDIGGHSECRRVDAQGNLLPDSPPWGLMPNWGANEGSNGPVVAPPPQPPAPFPALPGLPPPPAQAPTPSPLSP